MAYFNNDVGIFLFFHTRTASREFIFNLQEQTVLLIKWILLLMSSSLYYSRERERQRDSERNLTLITLCFTEDKTHIEK
jgi:hypothetical protein